VKEPFKIVERRNKFEVRSGRTVLSKHDKYLDAEDAALRAWLHKNMTMMMQPSPRTI
jgi:hypothetical protein